MRVYTVHTRVGAAPVLVREGFSWAAATINFVWFALNGAWIVAAIALAACVLIALYAPPSFGLPVYLALAVALGVFGRDLLRWTLDRRGFRLVQVVTGDDRDIALARVLERRPDLVASALDRAVME